MIAMPNIFLNMIICSDRKIAVLEENRIGGTYLWDWKIAAKKIIENMLLEADMKPIYYSQKAYFLALRLKFTNEQVKKLAYNALCFIKYATYANMWIVLFVTTIFKVIPEL